MAGVPRRESASPSSRDVTKCGVYHSIHPRAILFCSRPLLILTPDFVYPVSYSVISSEARNLSSLSPNVGPQNSLSAIKITADNRAPRRGPSAVSEPPARVHPALPVPGASVAAAGKGSVPGCEPRRAPLRVSHVPDSLDHCSKNRAWCTC